MSTMKLTIEELIFGCGGDLAVAFHFNVHQQTVRRWEKSGKVPKKYWPELSKLHGEGCSIRDIRDIHTKSKNLRAKQ